MLLLLSVALLAVCVSLKMQEPSMRIMKTERAYIEDVLDKYTGPNSGIDQSNLHVLALGSSYWGPPKAVLDAIKDEVDEKSSQRYGSIMGTDELREEWLKKLVREGYPGEDLARMDIGITVGAQQAFMNMAMMLCDQGDNAVLLAPYYFSHKLALQIAGANVHIAPYILNPDKPDWDELEQIIAEKKPKMVVCTSPANPSGAVFDKDELERLAALCGTVGAFLVLDETYYEFVYDDKKHHFVSKYENVVHIFSLSKCFGIPGWRVGAVVMPKKLTEHYRKVQDTNPTHTSILSQKLAVKCLRFDQSTGFVAKKRREMNELRESLLTGPLGCDLERIGAMPPEGAYYFLVPIPRTISEDEAVDILARQYGVLLLHGSIFGAPHHLRLSYGGLQAPSKSPAALEECKTVIEKVNQGFRHIYKMARERS